MGRYNYNSRVGTGKQVCEFCKLPMCLGPAASVTYMWKKPSAIVLWHSSPLFISILSLGMLVKINVRAMCTQNSCFCIVRSLSTPSPVSLGISFNAMVAQVGVNNENCF